MVRKAQKSGFSIEVENDSLAFLEEIHQKNMECIGGRAKKKIFFSSIPKYFEKEKDYKIWVARFENEPVSAMLIFYYQETVEYYLPVTVEKFRNKQPLSLLIFEAMKEAALRVINYGIGEELGALKMVYTDSKKGGALKIVSIIIIPD